MSYTKQNSGLMGATITTAAAMKAAEEERRHKDDTLPGLLDDEDSELHELLWSRCPGKRSYECFLK